MNLKKIGQYWYDFKEICNFSLLMTVATSLERSEKSFSVVWPIVERQKILNLSTDGGLTLETSPFNLFTVANLPYQLS